MTIWPRQEAIDEHLARSLLPGCATLAFDSDLTLERFWSRLVEATGERAAPLSEVSANLAVRAACMHAAKGSQLEQVARGRGFVAAAKRFCDECEAAGLAPARVTSVAKKASSNRRARLTLLAAIYSEYQRRTATLGLSVARRQSTAAKEGTRGWPLANVDEVVILPRLDWDPAKVNAVCALARGMSRGQRLVVQLPYLAERTTLYRGIDSILARFETHTDLTSLDVELIDPAASAPTAIVDLCTALFADDAKAPDDDVPAQVWVANSPAAELRAIAGHVRTLVDRGAAPESIAIAARCPGDIDDALGIELARVDVLMDVHHGCALATTPVGKLVLSLLRLREQGFPRENTLSLLLSCYVAGGVPKSDDAPYLPPYRIARLARSLGLRTLAPDPVLLSRIADGGRDPAADRRIAKHLLARLKPIADLPDHASVGKHTGALQKCMSALGFITRARTANQLAQQDDDGDAIAAKLDEALARDQASVHALQELLQELPLAAQQTKHPAISRPEYHALLGDLMSRTQLQKSNARGGAVKLVHLQDMIGRSFAHVLMPRLNDGIVPARAVDNGIFGADERLALNEALGEKLFLVQAGDNAGSRTPYEHLMLHGAIAAARTSLLFTWSATEEDRPAAPSPFVHELLRALPSVTVRQLPSAPVCALRDAVAPVDFVARLALEQFADPAGRLPSQIAPMARFSQVVAATHQLVPERMERIARVAAIERERLQFFSKRIDSGAHVGTVDAFEALRPCLGGSTEAPLAARLVETYSNCPFAFFADHLLRVRPFEENLDAPTARDRGVFAHDCLERFYTKRKKDGALPLKGDDADRAVLEQVCRDVLADEKHRPPGHAGLWQIGHSEVMADLWQLVENEGKSGTPGGGVPTFFELNFGSKREGSLPPLVCKNESGALSIGGRVDRVDMLNGNGGVVVIDYKHGRRASQNAKVSAAKVAENQLQLAIYAAAIRNAFVADGRLGQEATADAAFVSIRDGTPTRTLRAALGKEETQALVTHELPDRLARFGQDMRNGRFEIAPVDCTFCNYRTACRVMEPLAPDEDAW